MLVIPNTLTNELVGFIYRLGLTAVIRFISLYYLLNIFCKSQTYEDHFQLPISSQLLLQTARIS